MLFRHHFIRGKNNFIYNGKILCSLFFSYPEAIIGHRKNRYYRCIHAVDITLRTRRKALRKEEKKDEKKLDILQAGLDTHQSCNNAKYNLNILVKFELGVIMYV